MEELVAELRSGPQPVGFQVSTVAPAASGQAAADSLEGPGASTTAVRYESLLIAGAGDGGILSPAAVSDGAAVPSGLEKRD